MTFDSWHILKVGCAEFIVMYYNTNIKRTRTANVNTTISHISVEESSTGCNCQGGQPPGCMIEVVRHKWFSQSLTCPSGWQ